MGNHLIDPTSPEFNGKKFTRTWIYGVYGGRVTFFEEMLTREYMLSQSYVLNGRIHDRDRVRERKIILKLHSRTPSLLQDCASLPALLSLMRNPGV